MHPADADRRDARRRLPRAAGARRDPRRLPADRPADRPRADRLRGPGALPDAAGPGRAAAGRHARRRRPRSGLRDDLEVACWAAIAEAGAPPDGRLLFVNVSPDALGHPGLLELAGRLPSRLVIELTEQDAVQNYAPAARAAAAVDRPRRAGRRRRRGRRLHLARVRRRDPARLPQALAAAWSPASTSDAEPPGGAARDRRVRPRGRRARRRRGRRARRGARGAARRRASTSARAGCSAARPRRGRRPSARPPPRAAPRRRPLPRARARARARRRRRRPREAARGRRRPPGPRAA